MRSAIALLLLAGVASADIPGLILLDPPASTQSVPGLVILDSQPLRAMPRQYLFLDHNRPVSIPAFTARFGGPVPNT